MKNPKPKQIASLSAASLAVIVFAAMYLFTYGNNTLPWYATPGVALLTFVAGYYLLSFTIEHFIYRKIKLIYKIIYDSKSPRVEKKSAPQLSENVLHDVETQVEEWVLDKNRELEQLQKMERFRREFVGNVSHELRTPLFNIQGYIETLLDGGINDEDINIEYLKNAVKNVDRLSAIINDLEMISMIEAGEMKLLSEKFDFCNLASELMQSLKRQADAKKINLSFKKGCENGFFVEADREKIGQVVENLLSNSIKYGKENGETLLGCYDMEEKILVEVSDNGIGIEKHHLPRLFERFYRVDKNRSRTEGGTGLGLSIVKHIIEAHEQTITLRSTPGVGSTFGFTLKKSAL